MLSVFYRRFHAPVAISGNALTYTTSGVRLSSGFVFSRRRWSVRHVAYRAVGATIPPLYGFGFVCEGCVRKSAVTTFRRAPDFVLFGHVWIAIRAIRPNERFPATERARQQFYRCFVFHFATPFSSGLSDRPCT
jgi:hypothetical protein